jgi:hypothetical protein
MNLSIACRQEFLPGYFYPVKSDESCPLAGLADVRPQEQTFQHCGLGPTAEVLPHPYAPLSNEVRPRKAVGARKVVREFELKSWRALNEVYDHLERTFARFADGV